MAEYLSDHLRKSPLPDAEAIKRTTRSGSPEAKGELGELLAGVALWNRLSSVAFILHDVLLSTSFGTAQIDYVVFAPSGIWVVEVKNWAIDVHAPDGAYNQWWYGNNIQRSVYSPILQVEQHARIVAGVPGFPPNVRSVVAMVGKGGSRITFPSVCHSPEEVAEMIALSPLDAGCSLDKARELAAHLMTVALAGTPEEIADHHAYCRAVRARSCGPHQLETRF